MRKLFSFVVLSVVLFAGMQTVQAQKEEGKGKKGGDGAAQILSVPKEIELTADQETKVKEIRKSMADKAKAAQTKVDAIMSPEIKKKAAEARKTASEAGKKGKDAEAAINEALGLTADQQAALKEANKEASEVKAAFMAELSKILTDAQKEKMPKKAEPKKKKAE